MPILQTSLCKLLNIEIPIVQAPISGGANPSLVAAVSNAGGLGMFAMANRPPDGIRQLIREVRELTNRPFGANFLIRPIEAIEDGLAACLEEGVPIVSFAWDDPSPYIEQAHAAGSLVMYTVASAAGARQAVDSGVDVIVTQGWESGGHIRGQVATMPLVPRVVDAVNPTPVVAAGGIADGRGVAAALALGAAGVWIGTRFMLSEEAAIHPLHKERLLSAVETDAHLSDLFGNPGWHNAPGRALRNSTIDRWEAAGRPADGQRSGEGDVIGRTPDGNPIERYRSHTPMPGATGDIEAMGLWAGQSVGLVTDIRPAAEIVRSLMDEAVEALQKCAGLVRERG